MNKFKGLLFSLMSLIVLLVGCESSESTIDSVSDKVKLPFKAKFPFKVKSLLIVCEELGFAIIGFSIFCYNSIPSPNAKENFNVFALG